MKGRIRWALRLYPRAWRERYGAEFEALLEQTGLGWRDSWNVVMGAMAMQLRSISFAKLATVLGLMGLLAAGVMCWAAPKQYVSRAIVSLGDPAGFQGRDVRVVVDDTINMTFSRTSLVGIIQSERYRDLQRQAPMEDVIARMRRQIDVHILNAPKSKHMTPISVQFAYSDPETAERVTGALLSMLVSDFGRLKLPARGVQTLDPPSRPVQPVSPKIPLVLLAGLLGGVLLGVVVFGVMQLAGPRQTA